MSKTSKKYFEESLEKAFWAPFIAEIKNGKTAKEMKKILEKHLTPNERLVFEKRLGVAHLIRRGSTYKKIREIMDVTDRTISFVKSGFPKRIRKPSMGGRARITSFPVRNKKGFRMPAYKGGGGPRWPLHTL